MKNVDFLFRNPDFLFKNVGFITKQVDAGPGLAGVVGGCGSGGAHHGLHVIGGRYGLDLRQSQPTGTVSGTVLEGQRCAAIVYGGFESLSAVGMNITGQRGCYGVISTDSADSTFDIAGSAPGVCSLPMMPTGPGFSDDYQKTNAYIAGKMSFIDSTLDFSAKHCSAGGTPGPLREGGAAFLAVRSLFMQNVYVRGTYQLYKIDGSFDGSSHPSDHSSQACAAGGCHVEKLVYGIDPPPSVLDREPVQLHAPVYIDGVRQSSQKLLRIGGWQPVPADLIAKHRWPSLLDPPSFESPQCVNVKTLGAKGNGWTDDYEVIQNALDANECVYLPRGLYLTSRTLQVRAGRAMVGVARHLTRVTSMDAGLVGPPRHPNHLRDPESKVLPVVEVLPTDRTNTIAANQITTVAYFSISIWNHLDTTSALHIHADNAIYRQMHANRANRCGSLYRAGCKDSVEINYPLEMVSGVKHLKMYTFYDEDCCHEHNTSVSMNAPGVPAYWSGFLAGPQGPKYRHLLVHDTEGVGFYHLNCEHGTGEAICEFSHSTDLEVYGLKTEGRFVTLWVRDCDRVSVFGTGGCGCSANDTVYPPDFAKGYPPTLYRVERTPNFQFSSLIDQHSMQPLALYPNISSRPKDMFDEGGCPPSITHMLYVAQGDGRPPQQTQTYDRPALYLFGIP